MKDAPIRSACLSWPLRDRPASSIWARRSGVIWKRPPAGGAGAAPAQIGTGRCEFALGIVGLDLVVNERVEEHLLAHVLEEVVAVGTALTGRPPHGSVREELPHTALTSGNNEPSSTSRASSAPMPLYPGSESGESKVHWPFPLGGPLPSTGSADDDPSLFARFCGTMGPSDSLETCMPAVRP